jgi:predicted metal-dependent peptidase|tara:strand:- start:5864 stop:7102 length:1239 start_codon:yes stop_codon:yes gene_type:complete
MATDQQIIDKLVTARIALLLKHPFFGNLATRLKLINADEWCPTAGTDGRNFYYNTKFIDSLNPKEAEFLFGHEVLHNVFEHMLVRQGDRDHQIWNIAADYAVNQILVDYRIGEMPKGKKGENKGFQDEKYKDWNAERIYDDIYKQAKKNGKEMLKKMGELLDDHQEWGKGGGEGQSKDNKGKENGSGKPVYTKEELKKIRDEVKEAMISAAQSTGAGNLPGAIQRMVAELTEPKMDWREIIQQHIMSTIKSDYTWMRPSRKSWHTSAILPGQNNDEMIDICLSLDASGSISDKQCKEFLTEVKNIMDQYKDFKIHLWSFDTKVFNPKVFTPDNMDEILDYELGAGGGTEFECNWDYMKEEGIEPKKFIMFTDGWPFNTWGDEHYCDTIFLINNPYERNIEAPWGLTVHYDED